MHSQIQNRVLQKTKIMNVNKLNKLWYILLLLPLVLITSCKDDDTEPAEDPIASFQYEIDEANYLRVTFTSFSENAATYSWNFGDSETSAEENPVHTYSAAGDYTVVLTATNADGVEASKTESITITDPNEALKLLTGEVSKTWKLFREGTVASLGPDASNPAGWWSGLSNNGARPCLYEQTFTFHLDGQFVFDDMNVFWGENDPWSGTANHETCFEPTAANMVNLDGADVSAWGSGTHAFTYDPSTGVVVLNGMGAWMGLVHTVGNSEYSNVPTASRSFDIAIEELDGYDKMTLTYDYGDGGLWTIIYASYDEGVTEPEIVREEPVFGVDLEDITPSVLSNGFASATDFVLLDTITSGSTLVYGVDDPADATAAKVGQFNRVSTEQYQELKFQIAPEAKDIIFTNFTTVSIDVYIPSSNDYSGDLSKVVLMGMADQSATEQWWTDIYEYNSGTELAVDTWVTLTYQLASPDWDSDNGNSPLDRTDLDMFYINIGSGGHVVPGTFYVRNLKFQ